MCVYICIYIYIYINIYIYTYIYTYLNIYMYIHTCGRCLGTYAQAPAPCQQTMYIHIFMRKYTCISIRTSWHICIYIYIPIHICVLEPILRHLPQVNKTCITTFIYMCKYAFEYIHIYTYVYICAYVHICIYTYAAGVLAHMPRHLPQVNKTCIYTFIYMCNYAFKCMYISIHIHICKCICIYMRQVSWHMFPGTCLNSTKPMNKTCEQNTWGNAGIPCSVLQCVAVCCSVLQCIDPMSTTHMNKAHEQHTCQVRQGNTMMPPVAVCCSLLQSVAVCCSVLQCKDLKPSTHMNKAH